MSKSVNKSTKSESLKKDGAKIPRKRTGKGKTTTEIMHNHIQDINDVITDEDFKNLELELDKPITSTSHTPTIADDDDRPKDEDKDGKIVTPWDVIN